MYFEVQVQPGDFSAAASSQTGLVVRVVSADHYKIALKPQQSAAISATTSACE